MVALTVTRKADRAKMAAIVQEVAEGLGATVQVEAEDPTHEWESRHRRWSLKICVPGGAYLPVCISGDSPHRPDPNVFVCTWNTECDCLFAFSGSMGNVNPHHFSKVTRVGYGLEHLCDILREDIPKLLSGHGYSAERAQKLAQSRRDRLEQAREHYAPLVEAGLGTTNVDGTCQIDTPDQVREYLERIPSLVATVDAFIAAGCPMQLCSPIPYR